MRRFPSFSLRLPDWLKGFPADARQVYPTDEDRMRVVIELARSNVRAGTGGPFGAGVFDIRTHTLVAPGVNLVTSANCSLLHAEMVAILIAQQIAGTYDLGGPGRPHLELVASTAPCAMCLGAIPWSGVRGLVCGACDADARGIGFDEGDKPADWVAALENRGIRVREDVCRDEAVAVLRHYAESGGLIYNARRGPDN